MADQEFHIFQKEGFGSFLPENPGNVEKERPSNILKAFHIPANAEWLARKPAKEDFMVGHVVFLNERNVSGRQFAEIRFVGPTAIRINIGRKNAGGGNPQFPCVLLRGDSAPPIPQKSQ